MTPTKPEAGHETWGRGRGSFDDRQQHESSANYGRGHGMYRNRHEATHNKAGDDRQQYRQYQDQQYAPEQGRFRDRGTPETFTVAHNNIQLNVGNIRLIASSDTVAANHQIRPETEGCVV